MEMKKLSPAEELTHFLNFIDACKSEYQYACDIVSEEDRRLQDLLHEIEFAKDKSERNQVATRLHQSRKLRRENKDIAKQNENIVKFFEDQKNKETLNRMRQLLGMQRKEEEYLQSNRTYKPRAGKV